MLDLLLNIVYVLFRHGRCMKHIKQAGPIYLCWPVLMEVPHFYGYQECLFVNRRFNIFSFLFVYIFYVGRI